MKKHGQIEIVGLMVVVILLLVIILVALWFVVKPAQQNIVPQRQAIETKSILIALMKTTYDDENPSTKDISFQDKIIDCRDYISGENSCDNIKNKIEDKILKKVLINKKYTLEIKDESDALPFIVIGNDPSLICNNADEQKTTSEINIRVNPTVIKASLAICSKILV